VATLTIDDELGRLVSQAAAAQGKTLDEFVGEALRLALAALPNTRRIVRNGIPVMLVPDESAEIDPTRVRRCLEEEGF
jgi:hypothetical protein